MLESILPDLLLTLKQCEVDLPMFYRHVVVNIVPSLRILPLTYKKNRSKGEVLISRSNPES